MSMRVFISSVSLGLIICLGTLSGCQSGEPKAATLLKPAQYLATFSAPTTTGQAVSAESLQDAGRPTILFFGFTQCATICPITMSKLAQMMEQLKAEQVAKLPTVMLVSVDPDRDTLPVLKKYVTTFNPNFIGVRPSQATLQTLLKQFHLLVSRPTPAAENQDNYVVDHSGQLIFLDNAGRWQAVFSNRVSIADLVHDYKVLLRHA